MRVLKKTEKLCICSPSSKLQLCSNKSSVSQDFNLLEKAGRVLRHVPPHDSLVRQLLENSVLILGDGVGTSQRRHWPMFWGLVFSF